MLSNFPNWRSGVTFPVAPISCFTGEYYCCSGRLLNARFLAKKRDPGESILLMPHVRVLQVAWKMALQLGNHFSNWPFQTWMMCTSILALSVMVAGLSLWLSAVWAPKSFISNNQGKPRFPWAGDSGVRWSFSLLGGNIIYSRFPYIDSSVTYQLSFITFLMDKQDRPLSKDQLWIT